MQNLFSWKELYNAQFNEVMATKTQEQINEVQKQIDHYEGKRKKNLRN